MPTIRPIGSAISPGLLFEWCAGAPAGVTLEGEWDPLFHADAAGTPIDALWARHGAAVVRYARAFGFRPYRATGRRPRGPAFEAWRAAFLEAHGR
jgi:hypothetical protein